MADSQTTRWRWPFRRKSKPLADMTDAELGALVRRSLGWFGDGRGRGGLKRFASHCAALYLIGDAAESDAGTLTVNMAGVTIKGKDAGEWTVEARRGGSMSEDSPPVTLAGWLKPDKVDVAIDCFDRLTTMAIHMEDRANAES